MLLPSSEQTGYADVDEVLARHFYLMKQEPTSDDTFSILYDLNLLDNATSVNADNHRAFQRMARMTIANKATDDVRTLVQFVRLKQKGNLT